MSVDVHRDADVTVPHEILQRLGVHAGFRLIATVGVPADVRCDVRHEIGEAFCSALSIISYKLLETFLRHTLPIRNKPITVFALYDFSIKHQSSKLVTLHCWSPKCSVQRYFYKSGNT